MNNPLDRYVIEWSPSVKCFHFHTLGEAITKNLHLYLADARTDWVPIAVARDIDEACQMLEIFTRTNRHFSDCYEPAIE